MGGRSITKTLIKIMSDIKILHLINRLSFGATPGQIQHIKNIGIQAYIQSQLKPDSIPYPKVLIQKLKYLDTLPLTPGGVITELQRLQQQGKELKLDQRALNRIKRRFEQKIFLQATKGRMLRTLEKSASFRRSDGRFLVQSF